MRWGQSASRGARGQWRSPEPRVPTWSGLRCGRLLARHLGLDFVLRLLKAVPSQEVASDSSERPA